MRDELILAFARTTTITDDSSIMRHFSMVFSEDHLAADLMRAKEAHSVHEAEMRKALSDPNWTDDDWEGWYADYLIKLWWKRFIDAENAMTTKDDATSS